MFGILVVTVVLSGLIVSPSPRCVTRTAARPLVMQLDPDILAEVEARDLRALADAAAAETAAAGENIEMAAAAATAETQSTQAETSELLAVDVDLAFALNAADASEILAARTRDPNSTAALSALPAVRPCSQRNRPCRSGGRLHVSRD